MSKIDLEDRKKREQYLQCLVSGFVLLLLSQGILILSLSSWVISQQIFTCTFLHQYHVPVYLDLVAGAVVTVLGLFGVYNNVIRGGNLQFVRKLLWIFIGMVIIEISCAGMMGHDMIDTKNGDLFRILKLSQDRYVFNVSDDENCWDTLQTTRGCCGMYNVSDWSFPLPPQSCLCDVTVSKTDRCVFHGTSEYQVYNQGCYNILLTEKLYNYSLLIALNVTCAIVQVVQIVCSVYCVMKIQNPLSVHVS